jgi:hypothetical protein
MFTLPELKERGWTETIVWRLLGAPDWMMRDRPSGALVGLWRVDRVHAAQTTDEWAAAVDLAHDFEAVWSLRSGRRTRPVLHRAAVELPIRASQSAISATTSGSTC